MAEEHGGSTEKQKAQGRKKGLQTGILSPPLRIIWRNNGSSFWASSFVISSKVYISTAKNTVYPDFLKLTHTFS